MAILRCKDLRPLQIEQFKRTRHLNPRNDSRFTYTVRASFIGGRLTQQREGSV